MKIKLDSIAILFRFKTTFKDATKQLNFYRKLYGFVEHSKFSKYKYQRIGMLTKIPTSA